MSNRILENELQTIKRRTKELTDDMAALRKDSCHDSSKKVDATVDLKLLESKERETLVSELESAHQEVSQQSSLETHSRVRAYLFPGFIVLSNRDFDSQRYHYNISIQLYRL